MSTRRNSESRSTNGRHRADGMPSGWKRTGAMHADPLGHGASQQSTATKKSAITAALAVGVLAVSGVAGVVDTRDHSEAERADLVGPGSTVAAAESSAVPALSASATSLGGVGDSTRAALTVLGLLGPGAKPADALGVLAVTAQRAGRPRRHPSLDPPRLGRISLPQPRCGWRRRRAAEVLAARRCRPEVC